MNKWDLEMGMVLVQTGNKVKTHRMWYTVTNEFVTPPMTPGEMIEYLVSDDYPENLSIVYAWKWVYRVDHQDFELKWVKEHFDSQYKKLCYRHKVNKKGVRK